MLGLRGEVVGGRLDDDLEQGSRQEAGALGLVQGQLVAQLAQLHNHRVLGESKTRRSYVRGGRKGEFAGVVVCGWLT
jgi:hypothetical protein